MAKKRTTIHIDDELLRAITVSATESGRKEDEVVEAALRAHLAAERPPTLEDLRRRREELVRIAESHGARRVRVFGSVARGDARPDSDVDVLLDLEPSRTLLDLSGLVLDLEEALGRRADAVTARPSRTAEQLARHAVPL